MINTDNQYSFVKPRVNNKWYLYKIYLYYDESYILTDSKTFLLEKCKHNIEEFLVAYDPRR